MAHTNDDVQSIIRPRRGTRLMAWLRGVIVLLILTFALAACIGEAEEGPTPGGPVEEEIEPGEEPVEEEPVEP
jgi:hypothetical protein